MTNSKTIFSPKKIAGAHYLYFINREGLKEILYNKNDIS